MASIKNGASYAIVGIATCQARFCSGLFENVWAVLAVKKCMSFSSRARVELGFEDIRIKSMGCWYIGMTVFEGEEAEEAFEFESVLCLGSVGGVGG